MKAIKTRNMKRYYTNNDGFTLVEVVVTIAILAVVIGLTSLIILSSQNIFRRNASKVLSDQIAGTVLEYVKDELEISSALEISEHIEMNSSYLRSLYCENGRLMSYKEGVGFIDLFGDEFYNSYTIELYLELESFTIGKLHIVVYDSKEEVISKINTSLRFLNNNLYPDKFIKPNIEEDENNNIFNFEDFIFLYNK